jgi:hypothetical protein
MTTKNSPNHYTKKNNTDIFSSLIKKLCKTKINHTYYIKKLNRLLKDQKKKTKKEALAGFKYVAFNISRVKYFNNLEDAKKFIKTKNKKEKIKKWKIKNNQTGLSINI